LWPHSEIEAHEFLSRIVEIEAKNIDEAVSRAKEMYQNEEIVLDFEDFVKPKLSYQKCY